MAFRQDDHACGRLYDRSKGTTPPDEINGTDQQARSRTAAPFVFGSLGMGGFSEMMGSVVQLGTHAAPSNSDTSADLPT